jgi:hypothetical protein
MEEIMVKVYMTPTNIQKLVKASRGEEIYGYIKVQYKKCTDTYAVKVPASWIRTVSKSCLSEDLTVLEPNQNIERLRG